MSSPDRGVERLLFVYAADSGLLAAAADSARKLFGLRGCSLCSITHGVAGEKREWSRCRESLGVPVEMVHLDEITTRLEGTLAGRVPAVVAEESGELRLLLGPEALEECRGRAERLAERLETALGSRSRSGKPAGKKG